MAHGLYDDEHAEVTFNFTGTNAPSGAAVVVAYDISEWVGTAQQFGTEVGDAWGDLILPQLTNDITLSSVLVKFGPQDSGPSALVPIARAGSINATSLTPNTAFLVHKNTSYGGRRGRGRMYIPGVNDAVVDDSGIIASATVTSLNTALQQLIDRGEGHPSPYYHSLLHDESVDYSTEPPTRTEPPAPFDVASLVETLTLDPRVATQRRRLRR